ncbi:hypothetical protein [Enterococcus faecium]|uniref:hypothetical protein n=1 Tax=Enterococcus faecium TaxID=1352 RepID=UPI0023B2FCA1|nr:hypothetical protein [Enterococcus faecium]
MKSNFRIIIEESAKKQIRMLFDANYQNRFRPQYAKRIDAETGEMTEGVGNHVK